MSTEFGNPFALLDLLLSHNVPFVVIGGHAVNYYGYLRNTEDVDIIFRRTSVSEAALFAALGEADAFWIGNEIDPKTGIEHTYPVDADFIARTHLMMLGTRFGYLDIFDFVPHFPSIEVGSLIESADWASGRPFVSLEWLKKLKLAADRPIDHNDLANLEPQN